MLASCEICKSHTNNITHTTIIHAKVKKSLSQSLIHSEAKILKDVQKDNFTRQTFTKQASKANEEERRFFFQAKLHLSSSHFTKEPRDSHIPEGAKLKESVVELHEPSALLSWGKNGLGAWDTDPPKLQNSTAAATPSSYMYKRDYVELCVVTRLMWRMRNSHPASSTILTQPYKGKASTCTLGLSSDWYTVVKRGRQQQQQQKMLQKIGITSSTRVI